MFRSYPEGRYAPERSDSGDRWYVWCNAGALQALNYDNHKPYLEKFPDGRFTIRFANASYAAIEPHDALWEKMVSLTKGYTVKVFQLTLSGGYVPWTGDEKSLTMFDVILIRNKEENTLPLGDREESTVLDPNDSFQSLMAVMNPNSMPDEDARDFHTGAAHIPLKVTEARQAGQSIPFIKEDKDQDRWYWLMPDGEKIRH